MLLCVEGGKGGDKGDTLGEAVLLSSMLLLMGLVGLNN